MTQDELKEEYFQWLYHFVNRDYVPRQDASYIKLLKYLYDVEFVYILGLDGNRYEDGIELRYRFGYECGIEAPIIATELDDHPCSVLEMLIALSLRCEENIMYDPDLGDRTSRWFWYMIMNLGLDEMTDDYFDEVKTRDIIDRFLYREYAKDGRGGLVYIPNSPKDLRTVEIWYQMMWFLDEVYKEWQTRA